jgi:hypothetical protein
MLLKDDFGITHLNILFNPEAEEWFAYLMPQIEKQFKNIM